MNIKQIKGLTVNMVVPDVVGRIVLCGNMVTGVGQYGKWSIQPCEIKDGSDSIAVVFKNRQDMTEYEGKVVGIKSKTYKKKLSGMKLDEYNNVLQLSITVGAEVSIFDDKGKEVIKKVGTLDKKKDVPANNNTSDSTSTQTGSYSSMDRQRAIELQSARRDAAIIVSNMVGPHSLRDPDKAIDLVKKIASDLYHWQNGDTKEVPAEASIGNSNSQYLEQERQGKKAVANKAKEKEETVEEVVEDVVEETAEETTKEIPF